MKSRLLIVLIACFIVLVLLTSCKHESSLASVPELSDNYSVSNAIIDNTVKLSDQLTIEYPANWVNGIPYQDKLTGQIKGVRYDDHLQLHGDIGGYQSVISVLPPNKMLSYKDCISTIYDSITKNVEGIDKENILIEDKGDFNILSYSDNAQYNKTYVYKYDKDTTIIIMSLLDKNAGQNDINTMSNLILGMMKSVRPLYD